MKQRRREHELDSHHTRMLAENGGTFLGNLLGHPEGDHDQRSIPLDRQMPIKAKANGVAESTSSTRTAQGCSRKNEFAPPSSRPFRPEPTGIRTLSMSKCYERVLFFPGNVAVLERVFTRRCNVRLRCKCGCLCHRALRACVICTCNEFFFL